MSLAQRFYNLKTRIGGNREQNSWEQATGTPVEIRHRITMPAGHERRIVGQMEFAMKLSEAASGSFDVHIGKALDILEGSMESEGVLTKSACKQAEDALLPLAPQSKEYEIILAAHAHLDMNWMWGWQETVAATLSTFRTMLALMKEYPEFTYSQSQASVYKIVEDYDPAMMEEIKQRMKEGRWECTATAWVETDKNMPNTESLLRHIRYTRDYMRDVWGLDPESLEVDFSPDTFGHSNNIPEIDAYSNVRYYYHCRGHESRHVLYRWKSPSGSEVLVFCEPYWYNNGVVPGMGAGTVELAKLCGGLKTSLFVYGVGNHGGGPTRRDIEFAMEMQEWPVYPKISFGTFRQFFKKAETVRDKLPLWENEINFIFTGCYTTQSRLKLGNRKSEAALLDAESSYAMSNLIAGYRYPEDRLRHAWQNVLFTHFHDILTGSTVQETREHAMGLFADTMSIANTLRENSSRAIASRIDTSMVDADSGITGSMSEGAGAGFGLSHYSGVPSPETNRGKVRIYAVFNPSPRVRKEVVEITLWDWQGDLGRMEVTDHSGQPLKFQRLDHDFQTYWDHRYVRIYVEAAVPSMGYATVVVREKPVGAYPYRFHGFPRNEGEHRPVTLENEYLRAVFNGEDGSLVSLVDKDTGKERVKKDCSGGRFFLVSAERASNSAWQIGRHLGHTPVSKTLRLSPMGGELRSGFVMEQEILSSRITTTVTLDKGSKALAYSTEVHWNEYAKHGENVPVLIYSVPLSGSPQGYQTDTPAGHVRRSGRHQDVCGLQYGAAVYSDGRALAIISDCKYGYRGCDDALSVTLINSSASPDPYPERGVHKINLWVAVDSDSPKLMQETASNLCHPMYCQSTGSHKGDLPPAGPLVELSASSTVFSSMGLDPQGDLLLRVYETCGRDDLVSFTLPFTPKSAKLVDLDGRETGSVKISGNNVSFDLGAFRIAGVKVSK